MSTLPHQPAPDDPDDIIDLVDAEAPPASACPFCGVPLACPLCGVPEESDGQCFPDDDVVLDLDAFRAAVLALVDAGVVNTVGEA
jgi:hypothetical protein